MGTRVIVRPHEASVRTNRQGGRDRPGKRHAHQLRVAPPATQRMSQRRPGGVRGPRLNNPVRTERRGLPSGVPPAMVCTGTRLTDRGLAVAMALTIALVIAAVVCITTTAARVTAEPVSLTIAASA